MSGGGGKGVGVLVPPGDTHEDANLHSLLGFDSIQFR